MRMAQKQKRNEIGVITMRKRSFAVVYCGCRPLDRRHTPAMMPWLISEIKLARDEQNCTLEIKEDCAVLRAVKNAPTEVLIFEHPLQAMHRLMNMENENTFYYLLKEGVKGESQTCYVFHAESDKLIQDLFHVIRECSQGEHSINPLTTTTMAIDSQCVPGSCQQFEIMYVGKIKVSHRKAPPTFIDEAVEKFRANELEKMKQRQIQLHHLDLEYTERKRHDSGASVASLPPNLDQVVRVKENELSHQVDGLLSTSGSENSSYEAIPPDSSCESFRVASRGTAILHHRHGDGHCGNGGNLRKPPVTVTFSGDCKDPQLPVDSARDKAMEAMRKRTMSLGNDARGSRRGSLASEENRTMIFQIGRSELSLISLDNKLTILSKPFKEISHCSRGIKHSDHFGFICHDSAYDGFLGYILKCHAESLAEEVMVALKQSFMAAAAQQRSFRNQFLMCESCPMLWLHKLCTEVEGLTPCKAHQIIMKKIDLLDSEERADILAKYQGAELTSYQEHNEVLMMLLRALCEKKQFKHAHVTDGGLLDKRNPSVLDDLKKKAKRSLTSSFESILKKRPIDEIKEAFRERSITFDSGSKQNKPIEKAFSPMTPTNRDDVRYSLSSSVDDVSSSSFRPRSSTISSDGSKPKRHPHISTIKQKTSPMINLFMKVGQHGSKAASPTEEEKCTPSKKPSWRQAIFNRVVTPHSPQSKSLHGYSPSPNKMASPSPVAREPIVSEKRSPATLRALWKKAAMELITLSRMEKENIKLKAIQDAVLLKRVKLNYEEMTACLDDVSKEWDELLISPDRQSGQTDYNRLVSAVKAGVPRQRRGEIWQLLSEVYQLHHGECSDLPNNTLSYDDLRRQLTSYQHSICIDLGRTFPHHPYFAAPLGPGQLSLFNQLKAYSILDKEVGYCQGLSFIAGVLLLHLEEEQAFDLLKHMLFNLGIRHQFKPDMFALQVQMYQLSRLVHDNHYELYEHLEKHEIAPTLYAAPWFLTCFASQFPMGFVSRVFDLIFLFGIEVIVKVAVVLLGDHEALIMQCGSFEAIMEFLKTTLPSLSIVQMERVINQVFEMDISKQLLAYQVECNMLQEEAMSTEAMHRLEAANRNLRRQNVSLLDQLHAAQSSISVFQTTIAELENQVQALEFERSALRRLVQNLRAKTEDVPKEDPDCFPKPEEDVLSLPDLEAASRNERRHSLHLPLVVDSHHRRSCSSHSNLSDDASTPAMTPSTPLFVDLNLLEEEEDASAQNGPEPSIRSGQVQVCEDTLTNFGIV